MNDDYLSISIEGLTYVIVGAIFFFIVVFGFPFFVVGYIGRKYKKRFE
jgi:hypothetical protein